MLPILAALLIWAPALVGLGALAARLLGLSLVGLPGPLRIAVTLVLGMTALSLVGVAANFAVGLTPAASVVTAAVGGALLLTLGRRVLAGVGWGTAAFALAFCLAGARIAAGGSGHYDVGLYHLQAIRWMTEQAVPLGLANLHLRLAYSGSWFAVPAMLELPGTAGQSVRFVGMLLALALALVVFSGVRGALRGDLSASDLLAALSVVALLLAVRDRTVASSSSDWPITVVTLLVAVLCLRALERRGRRGTLLPLASVLTAFAVAVKWSALPLALLPAATGLALRLGGSSGRDRTGEAALRAAPRRCAAAAVLLLALALGRNVWVSGYPLYPSAVARAPGVPWVVPRATAEVELDWIRAWARAPGKEPQEVLGSWSWLGPWCRAFVANGDVVKLGLAFAVGLALLAWARSRSPLDRRVRFALLTTTMPAAAGVGFWFLTAPDIRLGMGALLLLSLSTLACGAVAAGVERVPRAWVHSGVSLALGLLVLVKVGPLLLRPTTLWSFPPLTEVAVTQRTTETGDAIFLPADGDQCWRAPLPCTPFLRHGLRIERAPSGRIGAFTLPDVP